MKILFALMVFITLLSAEKNTFDLIKKGDTNGSMMLVIGGIQGDEPGGYMSAGLLAQKYKIKNGSVWVVPNLNSKSILENSRGLYGDMNRKFMSIKEDDPDYESVIAIKEIIQKHNIDILLHLHDGSGLYRQDYIDSMRNPTRWGQSCIVDTEKIDNAAYGDLYHIASSVAENINQSLLDETHKFHVKNTKTNMGKTFEQREMLKTLTYFAIESGKPALANESSKLLPLEERVYYHLKAIESYFNLLGIEYTRDFELNSAAIKKTLYEDQYISINNGMFYLPLENARSAIRYVPMQKKRQEDYNTSTPLIVPLQKGKNVEVYYGSKRLTMLYPQYFEYIPMQESIKLVVDGVDTEAKTGDVVRVKERFMVKSSPHRVNAIGAIMHPGDSKASEDNVEITQSDFIEKYSVDKNGSIFRIEFYQDGKYNGMILVDFSKDGGGS